MRKNVANFARMLENVAKCAKMHRDVPKCAKIKPLLRVYAMIYGSVFYKVKYEQGKIALSGRVPFGAFLQARVSATIRVIEAG